MSQTWHSDDGAEDGARLSIGDWVRVVLRGVPLAILVFGGLAILLLLRLVERPVFGVNRPVTPWITQAVCRLALQLLGIGFSMQGQTLSARGAIVANHSSWLDIFALNACTRLYFVSKSEVAGWPGIGWLARATGTVFIERNPARAREQTELFRMRLHAGHRLLFFPEGTSTDGRRVLPFKSTLFAAFFDQAVREHMQIQPLSVVFHAPSGQDARFYGWWGDMEFGHHLLKTLGARRQGRVEVIAHEPVPVDSFANRKALASALETTVRAGVETRL